MVKSMFRKFNQEEVSVSGGYRKPTTQQRRASKMTKEEHAEWFRQIWALGGASTKSHPAPFPLELAYRLVRMFSFQGDTVLDPFCGTGTTMLAAMKCGRNSIGIEIDREYCRMAAVRLRRDGHDLFSDVQLELKRQVKSRDRGVVLQDEKAEYRPRLRRAASAARSS